LFKLGTNTKCIGLGAHWKLVDCVLFWLVQIQLFSRASCWCELVQMFGHIASDAILQPLGHFQNAGRSVNYPPICAGEFVEAELAAINLKHQA